MKKQYILNFPKTRFESAINKHKVCTLTKSKFNKNTPLQFYLLIFAVPLHSGPGLAQSV
jgi:hypothetical protein